MNSIADMSPEELAGFLCEQMRSAGIVVTLTGGACVAIWSNGTYISHDLDFIEEGPVPRRKIRSVLFGLGFSEVGRHFCHPLTKFYVEFPSGPLMVGNQRVENVFRRRTPSGELRLLSPTDCVKDRLAAYFHWNDRQSLEQALLVANNQPIGLDEIRRWAIFEGKSERFNDFELRVTETTGR